MTDRTPLHRLQVATVLQRFIDEQVLPGTGVEPAPTDDEIGQPDDLRRRAVVADQPDHRRAPEPVRETDEMGR